MSENTPKLTPDGRRRLLLDDALFAEIQDFYRSHTKLPEPADDYIQTTKAGKVPTYVTNLHTSLQSKLHAYLKPICEDWTKRKLVPTFVYGVRTYEDGAVLRVHRDREQTHIVSAIINVDQKVRKDWPLLIQTEAGSPQAWSQVFLAPGEVLLYEGCRLAHGRPTPFEGDFFANVFVHFALG